MRLTDLSLSPNNHHLLFSCTSSIFASIQLVLITLFCPSIKKIVSLLRFHLTKNFSVIVWAITPICRYKYQFCYFSFHFWFQYFADSLFAFWLTVLWLTAVISLSFLFVCLFVLFCFFINLFFLVLELSHLQFSKLASRLSPPFLDTYSQCHVSGVRLYAWSFSLFFRPFSSIVHFNNDPENLIRGRPLRCLFLWWDFCCRSCFQEVFCYFFFFHFSLIVSASNIPKYL